MLLSSIHLSFLSHPLRFSLLLLAVLLSGPMSGSLSAAQSPYDSRPMAPVVRQQSVDAGGSVAAIVNGHAVPMSDFRLFLNMAQRKGAGQPGSNGKGLGAQVLNQLIEYELIRQYAVAHGINVATAVNTQFKFEQAGYGGPRAFQQHLTQLGLTAASYKRLLTYTLLQQKVEQLVAPLNAKPQPVAHVRHILVSYHPAGRPARSAPAAWERASQVYSRLKRGGNFAALARQFSDDRATASRGGTLDIFHYQVLPEVEHAAFTLPLHHPSVVNSGYGFDIVEVLSRGSAVAPATVQYQAQAQVFGTWIQNQFRHARIQRLANVTP